MLDKAAIHPFQGSICIGTGSMTKIPFGVAVDMQFKSSLASFASESRVIEQMFGNFISGPNNNLALMGCTKTVTKTKTWHLIEIIRELLKFCGKRTNLENPAQS